ncbi:MAG: hypothetical protein VYB99_08485 [Pseudomonadota bacterium]|nr:hypothetical protein [Pseudomonadota bacterium]
MIVIGAQCQLAIRQGFQLQPEVTAEQHRKGQHDLQGIKQGRCRQHRVTQLAIGRYPHALAELEADQRVAGQGDRIGEDGLLLLRGDQQGRGLQVRRAEPGTGQDRFNRQMVFFQPTGDQAGALQADQSAVGCLAGGIGSNHVIALV